MQVLRTVDLVLDTLAQREVISPKKPIPKTIPADPKDKRAKAVEELLITERHYVYDLERLYDYQCALQTLNLLTADTIHFLFPNLNVLVDFQRRFLIGIEYHSQLPIEEQRIGSVFLNFQDGFEVYEGFALNQKKAVEIARAETDKLKTLSYKMDPVYELPSLLIKPIQRICKYPLLLQQLIKFTPKDAPNYQDQLDAFASIRHVTQQVNETQRRVENLGIVQQLAERLADWKGHNLDDFGALLHEGVFPVLKAGTEREYHLFLFEHIILCCKEAPPSKKSMTLSTKKSKPKKTVTGTGPLILKGRIYIAYITDVTPIKSNGYFLHIAWGRDDASDTGFFDIRFRNDEQLDQWETTISQMVARYNNEPNSDIEDSIQYQQYQIQQIQLQRLHNQQQGFTNNPQFFHQNQGRQNSQSFDRSTLVNGTSYDDASDDEGINQRQKSYTDDEATPRTTLTYPIDQAKEQQQSSLMSSGGMNNALYQQQIEALTQDISNSRLTNGPHGKHTSHQEPSTGQMGPSNMPIMNRSASFPAVTGLGPGMRPMNSNNNSNNMAPLYDIYNQQTASTATSATNSMTDVSETSLSSTSPSHLVKSSNMNGYDDNSWSSVNQRGQMLPSNNGNGRSGSNSSINNQFSQAYTNGSSGGQSNGTTPTSANGGGLNSNKNSFSSMSNLKGGAQIKVKLHYLDDTFLLIVPSSVSYEQLVDRAERKIRLCGKETPNPLRLKYKDEDDDFVTMRSDEDIIMALEQQGFLDGSCDFGEDEDAFTNGIMKSFKNNELLIIWAA